jgi:polygalacturonase
MLLMKLKLYKFDILFSKTCLEFNFLFSLYSIGSLGQNNSNDMVNNITVTNCLISNSSNGARIKTWASGSGFVSNVKFENIQMNAVLNPIIIDQFYCPERNCNDTNTNSELLISDVTYTNITGTYDTQKPAVFLSCSNKMPCVNITIVDMQLSSKGGEEPAPICANVSGCLGENVKPTVTCLRKGSSQFFSNLSKKGVKCTNS